MTNTNPTEPDFLAMMAQYERDSRNAWVNLITQSRATGADRFAKVQTGAGIGMIVNRIAYATSATVEEVIAKTADVHEIVATSDGRSYVNDWHEGESDIETWVYFERYVEGDRVAHGYIDPDSRRIVQTG